MALVLRLEIVAVDDTDRVIELKAVAETQTGARIKLKHPAVLDHDANAGRDEDGFVGDERKALGREEVVSGGTLSRAARQADLRVDRLGLFLAAAGRNAPVTNELFLAYFVKLCNFLHRSRSPR